MLRRPCISIFKLMLFAVILVAGPSYASSVPQAVSLGGQLFLPDGTPVTSPNTNFKVQIFDAAETCVLYSENHLGVDLRSTAGRFNLILGSGSSPVNNVGTPGGLDATVFANSGVVPVANCSQTSVALNAGDNRQIRISYDIGAGLVALSPDVPMVASAYAMVADSVQGKGAADFLQVVDNGTTVLNQANAAYTYSSVNWPRLKALLDGTSSQYLPTTPTAPVDMHNQRIIDVADPTSAQDVATKHYADTMVAGYGVDLTNVGPMTGNNNVLLWDAIANKWVAGAVNSAPTGAAGGDLSGTYPNPTIKDDAITASKINSTGGGPNRLLITDATTGATVGYGVCTINQVYAWTATGWACTSISSLAPVTSVAGRTGAITLSASDIGGLGTAALYDWGTASGQVPRLDGAGRMPAVDGSQLTNVNATQLQTRPVASTAPLTGQVLGFNGTAWIPMSAATGSVTNVASGNGLSGGPITSAGTLSVDVGTSANKILQLDPSAKIPAVDASQLYNVNASKIATRTVSSATPTAGQVLGFNTTTTQWEPVAGSAGSVTNIGTGNGILGGPITSTGTISVDVGTTANKILQLNSSAFVPAVDGSLLYNINATKIATRTVSSATPTAGQVLGFNVTTTQWEPISTGTGSGSVTQVTGGTGLTGGSITTAGTLNVDVGSAAGKIVQENANAQIAQTLGSAALPAYSFSGNTNTGLYSPGTNQLAIATAGTAAVNILANGYVGLGTATPAQQLSLTGNVLVPYASGNSYGNFFFGGDPSINQSGMRYWFNDAIYGGSIDVRTTTPAAGLAFRVDTGNGGTERLRLTAGGNIGIGTSAPQAGLDIATTGTGASAIIIPRDSTANRPSAPVNGMLRYNNTLNAMEGYIAGVWATISAGSSAGSVTNVGSGVGLLGGPITAAGTLNVDVGSSANKIVQENASAQIAQMNGLTSAPAYTFAADTATGVYSPGVGQLALSTAGTTRLNILANGNIGIGSASPVYALEVAGTAKVNVLRAPSFSSAGSPFLIGAGLPAGVMYFPTTGEVGFGNSTGTEYLRMNLSGNIGIGTNAPAAGLDIATSGTGGSAILIPRDSTANRPSAPVNGMLRYNNTLNAMEGYINSAWATLSSGSSAGSVTNVAGGAGLTGGPITSTGTLSVDVGTTASKIVQLNSNAQVATATGSAALPAYSFVGNTSTGMYSPGANQLGFATNGASAMTILADGRIGLGTSTPYSPVSLGYGLNPVKLAIWDGGGVAGVAGFGTVASEFRMLYAASPGNHISWGTWDGSNFGEKMRLDLNGYLGIGTSTAGAGLDIATTGTSGSAIIIPRDSTANRPSAPVNGMLRYNNTLNAMEGYIAGAWSTLSSGSSAGSVTNVASGVGLYGGPITSTGTLNVDVGTAANKIVQLNPNSQIAPAFGSVALPSYAFTGNAATGMYSPGVGQLGLVSNGTAALNVAASGNIGVGNASPVARLDVNGVVRATGSANLSSGAGIELQYNAGSGVILAADHGASSYVPLLLFGNPLNLYGANGSGMTVDGRGFVGIGSSVPSAALDINITGTGGSAIVVPRDTTANRPSAPVNGMLRYNNTLNAMEGYIAGAWATLASGSSAGSVTSLTASTGLLGGVITSTGTIAVDVGTAASKIPQLNTASQIALANGAAATPSYSFAGNASTGLFAPGTGQLALATNGAARMTLLANGNVGVGTASPTALFEVNGTTALDSRVLLANGASLYGHSSYAGVMVVENSNANSDSALLIRPSGASGSAGLLLVPTVFDGSSAQATLVYDGSGLRLGTPILAAPIDFVQAGTSAIRIANSGSVGVGTTTPQAALDIFATGTAASAMIVPRDTTANRPSAPVAGMIRYNNTTSKFEAFEGSAWTNMIGASSGTAAGGTTQVQYNNAGAFAGSSNFVWDNTNGRLGINSASPGYSLDVVGNVRVSASALISGNTTVQGSLVAPTLWGSTASSGNLSIDSTSSGTKGVITIAGSGGNVAIGTTTPTSKLTVNGAITTPVTTFSGSFTCGSSTLDYSSSNFLRLSSSNTIAAGTCGVPLSNMVAGGSYTLVVTGNSATNAITYSFSGYTFKYLPTNAATTAGKDTIYTFLYDGTTVYVTWTGGY